MSRPVEEEDDDPLTSLSLPLPGTNQRFHHDCTHSQFQELAALTIASTAGARSRRRRRCPGPAAFPFNPDFMVAMLELIRAVVQQYLASVEVRARCGLAGGAELCMPQLMEAVLRAAVERVGAVGRIQ
ncbi:unnamed protein product [Urochloa humidicola]